MSDEDPPAPPRVPSYPADAFVGTAAFYADYRPAYPDALLDDLLAHVGVTHGRRLLDLACGPGSLTLPLSRSFDSVWAIDLEPEMIERGRALAEAAGVRNVDWMVGRAEDLGAPASSFDLITAGNAFHRVNRPLLARRALSWLVPGGSLAELGGSTGIDGGPEPWQKVVAEVLRDRLPPMVPPVHPDATPVRTEVVLEAAGFVDVSKHERDVRVQWSAAGIVGYLFSTSFSSRRVLGEDADDFAAALRAALAHHDPSDCYTETMSFYFLVGKKPEE